MRPTLAVSAAVLLAGSGCTRGATPPPGAALDIARYEDSLATWRARRHASLTAPDGWTTVAGLHWLDTGVTTLGSSPSSGIVLPARLPERVGLLRVDSATVYFVAERGAPGLPRDTLLATDRDGARPTVIELAGVSWRVIERGGRRAVRVRDTLAPARLDFQPLRYLPTDTAQRVAARLKPTPGRTVTVATIVGFDETYDAPGTLAFTLHGQELTLAALQEKGDSSYFIIFRDATAQDATYPAGRFLKVAPVDSTGWTVIDFNRAYNPPCAFTAFATCPLPPRTNILPVAIRAGELRPAGAQPAPSVAAAQ